MSNREGRTNSRTSSRGSVSSPVSSEGESRSPIARSTSVGMSRRPINGGSRISVSRTDRGTQVSADTSAPARRTPPPTSPIGRGSRNGVAAVTSTSIRRSSPQRADNNLNNNNNRDNRNDNRRSYSEEEMNYGQQQRPSCNSSMDLNISRRSNTNQRRLTITRRQRRFENNGQSLSWYERLMPEFVLSMTSPLTGYESRLDSDVEEDEYEILERQRIKRNRKVRRRLLTLVLIAAAASAFMYSQGRLFRRVGVRAAMTGLQRYEHSLSKSVKDVMGK